MNVQVKQGSVHLGNENNISHMTVSPVLYGDTHIKASDQSLRRLRLLAVVLITHSDVNREKNVTRYGDFLSQHPSII